MVCCGCGKFYDEVSVLLDLILNQKVLMNRFRSEPLVWMDSVADSEMGLGGIWKVRHRSFCAGATCAPWQIVSSMSSLHYRGVVNKGRMPLCV
jgi:hypothetical protein